MQTTLLNVTRCHALIVVLAISLLGGCRDSNDDSVAQASGLAEPIVLFDFEDGRVPGDVVLTNATAALDGRDATNGDNALVIKLQSQENINAGFALKPDTPWDWSEFEDFSIAMDIANRGEVSTQLRLDVSDIDGQTTTRTVSIPVGGSKTYYSKMHGHDLARPEGEEGVELNFTSGLRSNPPTWASDDEIFISLWGAKNLNLAGITRIALSVGDVLHDKELTVDNIRLIANPPMDEAFLEGIVDEYGQNAKLEFTGKIHSDDEMHAQRDAEIVVLEGGRLLPDRSRFSGWKDGPKLEATGYFRTENVNGMWSLVDPDGYLYFATGLDIIRLSNSTTMTGFDFDQDRIRQRSADDLTPEDSEGLNRVSDEAVPSRHLVSEVRAKMFNWLPDYDGELGNHFGYRRTAHSGPLPRGETFSFYSANLERKYGEETPKSYLDAWEEVTTDRMLNWGFTSFGNWTDPRFYDQQRIPFFANGWIIGDFKTVSSGNDFWAPVPDVFDPLFEERAMITAKQVADEIQGTPWCVGIFMDNEKSFGRAETRESQLGIVLNTLQRDGNEVPSKRKFTNMMREKYESIEALNDSWGTTIASWDKFDSGIDADLKSPAQEQDYSAMLEAFADKYFATVRKAVKTHMPNHMYLGSRFADWGMPPEFVSAAARHVDVMSYNVYKEGLHPERWKFLEELDMPSIIGEFHFGASDSGLFHSGLLHAADQEDRARMYKEYMHSVIDNPYFIGAHWFQYIDSPITGRALDGENYNVGFVSVADVPYAPMVRAAKELHSEMYQRRFGE